MKNALAATITTLPEQLCRSVTWDRGKELSQLGLLGDDMHLVHANELSNAEFRLISESGGTVTISPYAEMTGGHGHVTPARMIAHHLPLGLSADATGMAPGEMFSEMRTAFACARTEQLPEAPTAPYQPTVHARDAQRTLRRSPAAP